MHKLAIQPVFNLCRLLPRFPALFFQCDTLKFVVYTAEGFYATSVEGVLTLEDLAKVEKEPIIESNFTEAECTEEHHISQVILSQNHSRPQQTATFPTSSKC